MSSFKTLSVNFNSVEKVELGAASFKASVDNFHACIIGAVRLAVESGRSTGLTRLFECGGLFGPVVKNKKGEDRHTLTKLGQAVAFYILAPEGLGLGADEKTSSAAVLRLDRTAGKWYMGDGTEGAKWKSAWMEREQSDFWEAVEMRFDLCGKVTVEKVDPYNVAKPLAAVTARLNKALKPGSVGIDRDSLQSAIDALAALKTKLEGLQKEPTPEQADANAEKAAGLRLADAVEAELESAIAAMSQSVNVPLVISDELMEKLDDAQKKYAAEMIAEFAKQRNAAAKAKAAKAKAAKAKQEATKLEAARENMKNQIDAANAA